MKMSRRLLALLMTLMLMLTALPVGAIAEGELPLESKEEQTTVIEAPAPQETPEVKETPAEETPAEETPAEETPAAETPAEETPVEETPAEETPAEETPAEEVPAEEVPTEETPTEETPTEEVPTEDIPAEEDTEEEAAQQLAETPVFVLDLSEEPIRYSVGDEAEPLKVDASVQDGGTIHYQWYYSLEDENGLPEKERTAIADATKASYTPETLLPGVGYCFVEATNVIDASNTACAISKLVRIEVVEAASSVAILSSEQDALLLSETKETEKVRVIVENTTYPVSDGAPWDGRLLDEWVTINSNSSAMSCVVEALSLKGYSQTGAESNYISEINGLNAFDGGFESGWMGTLNDWFTNEGFGAFTVENGTLQNGDTIRIMYTSNGYGEDLGGSWNNNDKTVKSIAFSAGKLSPAFDKEVHDYTLSFDAAVQNLTVTPEASNKNFQVRIFIKDKEYKHTDALPIENGTVISVKCGDPTWPTMNYGSEEVEAEHYTITVLMSANNAAPTLVSGVETNATIALKLGEAFEVDLSAIFEDADHDALSYTVAIDGEAPIPADASYSYTGEAAGSHTLIFYANDGKVDSTDSYSVNISFAEAAPLLKSLIVHTSSSPNATNVLLRNSEDAYDTQVVFNPETFEYTLAAQNDNVTQLRFRALADDPSATVSVKWADQQKTITWKSGNSKFANCLTCGKNVLEIVVSLGDKSTSYLLNVDVLPTLSALSFKADQQELQLDKDFSSKINDYALTVPADATAVSVEAKPSKEGYTIKYDGGEASSIDLSDPEKTSFTITVECGEVSTTYSISIKRVAAGDLAFIVLPAEAEDVIITVLDNKGIALAPNEDGNYSGLFSEFEYSYTLACYGYITQKGIVPAEGGTISVTLLPNGGTPEAVDSEWSNFRGNDSNMGITDVQTPIDPESTALLWNKKLGISWQDAPSVQIIVDDALIVMSGKKIYKLDLSSGDILAEADMDNKPSYGYTPPIYADGMIICPLGNGTIQAFNAKSLESVWIYHDPLKGQALSPITYSDGYIYTGFWNSEEKEANYVCLSVSDDEPDNTQAEKLSTWNWKQAGGFYWAGSVAVGNALIVGTDDGNGGYNGDSKLYSFNKKTGKVIDTITLTGLGDQRSTISYDKGTGRGYFTTKDGYLCSVRIDANSGKLSDLKSVKNVEGAQSTSTPVVYEGKVYYGVGGGFTDSPLNNFVAADAESLQMDYAINLKGYPQCSMLLSTAYEEDGYLYFYSTYNTKPGGISMIKVKKGSSTAADAELIELFDAKGFEEHCITSMICDKNGTLYYKNDSANVFAIGTPSYGNVIQLIKAIGEVTESSVQSIENARNAYNALSEENRAKVTNYQALLDAEAALKALVEAALDAIGEDVTLESEDEIQAAEQLFASLSEEMQAAIENAQKLSDAKVELSALKLAEAQRLIDAIPEEITRKNKDEAQQAVTEAQAFIEHLTEEELAAIIGLERLEEAQKLLEKMVAGGSTRAVRVGVIASYKLSKATSNLIQQIDALLEAGIDFEHLEDEQERQIIEVELAYRALTDDEKLFVSNYPDFKLLLERFGEHNHIDAVTGIRLVDSDWNIRLVIREMEVQPGMAETMRAVLSGHGEMLRLMQVEMIDLLSGEVYQGDQIFTLLLPAEQFDSAKPMMLARFDADGQMSISAPTLVKIDPASGKELSGTDEIADSEAPSGMQYLKLNADKAQCRYASVALDIPWEQLIECIAYDALPESWNEWQ